MQNGNESIKSRDHMPAAIAMAKGGTLPVAVIVRLAAVGGRLVGRVVFFAAT